MIDLHAINYINSHAGIVYKLYRVKAERHNDETCFRLYYSNFFYIYSKTHETDLYWIESYIFPTIKEALTKFPNAIFLKRDTFKSFYPFREEDL